MTDDRQAGSASDRIDHEGTKARRTKVHRSIRAQEHRGAGILCPEGGNGGGDFFSKISANLFHSVWQANRHYISICVYTYGVQYEMRSWGRESLGEILSDIADAVFWGGAARGLERVARRVKREA
jgi:hypothetical protein